MRALRVVIVGAGLAGSLLARALATAGHRVDVYERRPDPREAGYAGGRSINLALSARGLRALHAVGLEAELTREALPMRGRMVHGADGTLVYQPYSRRPEDAINSVSRAGLNLTLLRAAGACPGVSFHFDHPCVDLDLAAPAAMFRAPDGRTVRAEADLVVGADGAYSAVRSVLQRTDRFDYAQSYLEHGYKELHIPGAEAAGVDPRRFAGFAMDPGALHIWPRGGAMMIALPNRDRTFTCTLFWPYAGADGFDAVRTGADALALFRREYPDAVPLMPTLAEDYARNPTGSLVTIRCHPWHAGGRVVLVGDAAHAIVPFYGQGMNCAFEDCIELAERLRAAPGDLRAALAAFQAARKPNADAIADMALENFVEMRDLVGSPDFRYRKRVEQVLHGAYPERAAPQYNLVSFSTVPYTEARRRGRELAAVVDRVVHALPRAVGERMGDADWERAVTHAASAWLGAGGAPS